MDAAIKAGTERFRAIMLTSLTTFFGLLPILLETSFSAQMVIPMAVSLGFGILFATVITLILIPCLYIILDDLNSVRWTFWKTRTSQ
jgi:multidrug efflux pump subunit AcrB